MSVCLKRCLPGARIRMGDRRGLRERLVRRLFSGLDFGVLSVSLPSGQQLVFNGASDGPHAVLHIKRWRMLLKTVLRGDLGFADAYIDNDWDTPDLTAVIRLMARNSDALSRRIRGLAIPRLLARARYLRRRNSKRGSRRNIEAHYDLGNSFYAKWLDPQLIYSSAIWPADIATLEEAQERKLDTIVGLCAPRPGDRILEIGSGWGALAIRLAQARADVTGITLSPAQLEFSRTRASDAKMDDNITIELRDYRDLSQTFDKIVSIEMIEAVGESYMREYFKSIGQRLRDRGAVVIQAITIDEDRFEAYRDDAEFIQTYIFPGGFLPSTSFMTGCAADAGFRLEHCETFGSSYARTLEEWQRRFNENWREIELLGFDERFRRIWNYYLSYCAGGFLEGAIDVGLYVFRKSAPDSRSST